MPSTLDALAGKLDRLASCDSARRVFGADEHAYARAPVAEAALVALEAEAGFALPEDYRQWMRCVGSGAGPHYGLWAPEAAIQQMRATPAGSGGRARDPACITHEHLAALARRLREGVAPGDACITTDTIRGAVPIGQQGCNGYAYLVLAGDFAGSIFGECADCVGEPWTAAAAFLPAGAPARLAPPTFLAWLEDWLDCSLAEVGVPAR